MCEKKLISHSGYTPVIGFFFFLKIKMEKNKFLFFKKQIPIFKKTNYISVV